MTGNCLKSRRFWFTLAALFILVTGILAGARARQYQKRPGEILHRFRLLRVKAQLREQFLVYRYV